MQRQTLAGEITVHRFERLPGGRLDALVTGRSGGVSAAHYDSLNLGLRVGDRADDVIENRRRLFAAAGMSLEKSVWCRQVHDDAVSLVTADDIGRGSRGEDDIVADTDALVTDLVGVPLCVIVADCVPVLIYDPDAHVLGLAHAGWAGTVKRIASRTVEAMVAGWGCEPSRMLAAIGPSIGAEDYEVGEDVAEAARAAFGGAVGRLLEPRPTAEPGKYSFDLWAANLLDLGEAGLSPSRIEVAGLSSARNLAAFYSYRAEGVTGRFAAIASLRPL